MTGTFADSGSRSTWPPSSTVRSVTQGFDDATAVELLGSEEGTRRYRAEIHDGWDIGGNANGGLRARHRRPGDGRRRRASAADGHRPLPRAGSRPGRARSSSSRCAIGRRLATCTASLVQGGRELIRVLGTFGRAGRSPAPSASTAAPPELPPYERVPGRRRSGRPAAPGARPHGWPSGCARATTGSAPAQPSGRAEIAGWFAFAGEEPIDEIGLLLAADALAPAVFNTDIPVGWVPTVELTVHVRAAPAPGPLRCVFRTRFITGGMLEEDGEIWDAAGTLVAQSRQLALTPAVRRFRPPGASHGCERPSASDRSGSPRPAWPGNAVTAGSGRFQRTGRAVRP